YGTVLERRVADGVELRTRHYFTDYSSAVPNTPNLSFQHDGSVPYNKTSRIDNFVGLEYKTKQYRSNPDGSYTLVHMDSTVYGSVRNDDNYVWNVQCVWG